MSEHEQLTRIERTLEEIRDHLTILNGSVARHEQTLYGPDGRSGLEGFKRWARGRIERLGRADATAEGATAAKLETVKVAAAWAGVLVTALGVVVAVWAVVG